MKHSPYTLQKLVITYSTEMVNVEAMKNIPQ